MTRSVSELWERSQEGTLALIDVRTGKAYTEAHVPGSVSAPFRRAGWGSAVTTWLLSHAIGEVGILADNGVLGEAARDALEGQITVVAVLDGGPSSWEAAGLPLVLVPDVTADELARTLPEWVVIDVREAYEWRSGLVPGALMIPMGQLGERSRDLDRRQRYAIICATGNRSEAAAAYLADLGFTVANVRGGMSLWLGGQHPLEHPPT
jgi:rhodanese-related sulfurtransferase